MKKLFIAILFLTTFNVGAVTINETTNPLLDSVFVDVGDSHWDKSTGLEWLDMGGLVNNRYTFGHSINSAEAAYNPQGWRLATYLEVYGLWDMFFPGIDGKTTVEEGDGQSALIQSRNSWLFGFGSNASVPEGQTSITVADGTIWSTGLFVNEQGSVDILGLKIETNPLLTTLYGPDFTGPSLTLDSAYNNMGVFMVRDYVPPVPVPAAVWLFGAGLIALFAMARRKA